MKFPKVNKVDDPVEIFNPVNLNKSEGLLHSYRSETRKEAYQLTAQSNTKDPKTFYSDLLSKVSYAGTPNVCRGGDGALVCFRGVLVARAPVLLAAAAAKDG